MATIVEADNCSSAWVQATDLLLSCRGHELPNLVVVVRDPLRVEAAIDSAYRSFCSSNGIKDPSHVAATIFPRKAYSILRKDRHKLYAKYPKLHQVIRGPWGSYFSQMIDWKETDGHSTNQLEAIIRKMSEWPKVPKAAFTISIANPLIHGPRPRGGPCLHYLLLQLEARPRTINLLAVYRNHDFTKKAYGNYVGLGHLLEFLSDQSGYRVGQLTCLSSHAFLESHVAELRAAAVATPQP